MSKLQKLRDAVLSSATQRPLEADQVFTYVDRSKVQSGPTFLRYEGTALVFVLDVRSEHHPIVKAISDYLRDHEPQADADALEFDVDLVDHDMFDLKFTLPFTESVVFDGSAWVACDASIPDPNNLPLK